MNIFFPGFDIISMCLGLLGFGVSYLSQNFLSGICVILGVTSTFVKRFFIKCSSGDLGEKEKTQNVCCEFHVDKRVCCEVRPVF